MDKLSASVISAVDNYIAHIDDPSKEGWIARMDILKYTNGGHLALSKEQNKAVIAKYQEAIMKLRTDAPPETPPEPTPAPHTSNVPPEVQEEIKSSVAANADKQPAAGKELVSEGVKENIHAQIPKQPTPGDQAAAAPKQIPPRPDKSLTPYKKVVNDINNMKKSDLFGHKAKAIREEMHPKIEHTAMKPGDVREELKAHRKKLKEAKKLENSDPLIFSASMLNGHWIEYMDSLGSYASTPPMDELVDDGYVKLGAVTKSTNEF